MRRDLLARLDHAMRIEFEAHKTAGSPTERGTKDHIDYFLDRWDSNRDGHLSFEEARKAFEDLGLNLTNKQHWRLMRAADPDRSGQVDLQELRVFLHQTNEGATSTNAI
jgi:Ca2+-binding EF-hand superfamily protein